MTTVEVGHLIVVSLNTNEVVMWLKCTSK